MNYFDKNENGYSLLEVILSISLLSIVILFFFGFFIQANSVTVQSQSKMSAGQFSQEILSKIRSSTVSFHSPLSLDDWKKLYPSQGGIDSKNEFYIQVDKQKYYPVVSISHGNGKFSGNLEIINIQIWVYQNGEKIPKFQTYGFRGSN